MKEATATIIAAKGPNTAAAKTVGRTEIDVDTAPSSQTRPRSATAATIARASTAYGLPTPYGTENPKRTIEIASRTAWYLTMTLAITSVRPSSRA